MGPVGDRQGFMWIARGVLRRSLRTVETAAFWLAIALPVLYGPLLLAASASAVDPQPAFYLLAVHAVAVVLGQRYGAD